MKNLVFVRLQDFPPTSSIDLYYYAKYLWLNWKYNIKLIVGRKVWDIDLKNVEIIEVWVKQNHSIFNIIIFFIKSLFIIKNINKDNKIDFIYFFSMHPVSVILQFFSKYLFKLKTIYDVTSWPIWKWIFAKISYFTIKIWIFLSDKFILDDNWLYKKLNLNTDKKFIDVWIWYDHNIFYEKKWLDLFNKTSDNIIFTYVGNLNRERNLDVFIKAFIENLKNNKNIKLFLIWWWTNELYLNKLSWKYLNNNIFFLWKKEHKIIPDYINSSDILVSYIPKVDYFEHQPPTKLIEYLSCNKPVIVTNTISQKNILKWYEFLIHEDDILSTSNKINYFINNINDFKNKNYSRLVDEFTWEKLVEKISKLIN